MSETLNETSAAAPAETKTRANSAYTYRVFDGKHEWDFGKVGKFVVDPDKISMEGRHFLLAYGIKQWVNDGAAGESDAAGKFSGSLERAEILNSGATDLRARRESGGGQAGIVTLALVRAGIAGDVTEAQRKIKAIADKRHKGQLGKARDEIAKLPAVRAAIRAIEDERAAADGAGDDLAAELEGL